MTAHISTLDLHRHRYGELAGDAAERVASHLQSCERCQRRLGVQQAERNSFAITPIPPAIQEIALPTRPANRPIWPRVVAIAAVALAAAAVGVLGLPREGAPIDQAPEHEDIRAKGDLPTLEVWVDSRSGPRALRAGEALHAGDRVQLLFRPEGASWVTLAGTDGAGNLELWGSFEPLGNHLQPAPFGLTLDETAGDQAFHLLRSPRPLEVEEVRRALAGEADDVDWESITVPKR